MFYTHKNALIKLDNNLMFVNQVELNTAVDISPVYVDGKRHSFSYSTNGPVASNLKINYFLTGEDFLKRYLSDDNKYISGNIGGIYFRSGCIRSYTASFQPNSPIQIGVDLAIFDTVTGQFTPSRTSNPSLPYLNVSDSIFTNYTDYLSLGSIIQASYNYTSEIEPFFNQKTDNNLQDLGPNRIFFGKKQVVMEMTSDSTGMYLPLNGSDCSIRIQAANSGGSILETFAVTGKLNKRNFSISPSVPINQKFEVIQHRVASQPVITSFSPTLAYADNKISVYGQNFQNVLSVSINDEPASSFDVISDSQIDFTVSKSQNSGYIKINTFEKSSVSSTKIPISYPDITVSSFEPRNIESGKSVLIQGENFYKISQVLFNDTNAESFNIVNSNYINAFVPGRILNNKIKVISDTRVKSGESPLSYWAYPVIDSFTPTSGVPGDTLTLNGANLTGIFDVKINNISSAYLATTTSSMQITVPQGNTLGYITIENEGGQVTQSKYGFFPQVRITGLSLRSGFAFDALAISGVNFAQDMLYNLGDDSYKLSFNGQNTGFYRVDSQTLTGLVPKGGKTGPIYIYKPDGASTYAATGDFIYIPSVPVITNISPSGIISGDSIKTLIVGENLVNLRKVYFSGSGANTLNQGFVVWDNTYNVNSKPADDISVQYLISTAQNDLLGLASTYQHTLTNPSSFSGNTMLTGLAIRSGIYNLYVESVAGTGMITGALTVSPLQNIAQLSSTRVSLSSNWPSGDFTTYGPEKINDLDTGTFCQTDTVTGSYAYFKFSSACQIFNINVRTAATGYNFDTTGYLELSLITGSGIGTGIIPNIASSGFINITPYSTLSSGYGINTNTQSWRHEANAVLIRAKRKDGMGQDLPYPLVLSNVEIYGVKMPRAQ